MRHAGVDLLAVAAVRTTCLAPRSCTPIHRTERDRRLVRRAVAIGIVGYILKKKSGRLVRSKLRMMRTKRLSGLPPTLELKATSAVRITNPFAESKLAPVALPAASASRNSIFSGVLASPVFWLNTSPRVLT